MKKKKLLQCVIYCNAMPRTLEPNHNNRTQSLKIPTTIRILHNNKNSNSAQTTNHRRMLRLRLTLHHMASHQKYLVQQTGLPGSGWYGYIRANAVVILRAHDVDQA